MNKITQFFKNFWWVILVPVGLFLVSTLTRKDSSKLNSDIKEKKKEIKETEKEIEIKLTEVQSAKEELAKSKEEVKNQLKTNLDNKEIRDEEAKKFFDNM